MNTKAEFRQEFRQLRAKMTNENRESASKKILQTAQNLLKNNQQWKRIALYLNDEEEVATANLIDWAVKQKYEVYLPRVEVSNKTMTFYQITPNWRNELVPHQTLKICEPQISKLQVSKKFDVVFMPLITFDQSLNRIGRGGGYYDRWLQSLDYQPLKIGLAYQIQYSPLTFPKEVHDQDLDLVITDLQNYQKNNLKI